jgi:hypothetical protein
MGVSGSRNSRWSVKLKTRRIGVCTPRFSYIGIETGTMAPAATYLANVAIASAPAAEDSNVSIRYRYVATKRPRDTKPIRMLSTRLDLSGIEAKEV